MIQLALLGLAIMCLLAGILTLVKGEISITRNSRIKGRHAIGIGAGIIIVGLLLAGFAWLVLPQIR
jgi:hypothetical protein